MTDQPAASPAEPQIEGPQLLKMLVELGPLAVFFIVNSQAGRFLDDPSKAIFWGTGCFMVATLIALAASKALFGRIPLMPLISGFFVVVFGGLTLILQDELFIKMKPTIVNAIFAVVLFGGPGQRPRAAEISFRRSLSPDRGRLENTDIPMGVLLRISRAGQ